MSKLSRSIDFSSVNWVKPHTRHTPVPRSHKDSSANAHQYLSLIKKNNHEINIFIKALDVRNDEGSLTLLTLVNLFAHSLHGVLFDLQRILLDTYDNEFVRGALAQPLKNLGILASILRSGLLTDPDTLKVIFLEALEAVEKDVSSLASIVSSGEDKPYKHDIVQCIYSLLVAVLQVSYRKSVEKRTHEDRKNVVESLTKQMIDSCKSIQDDSDSVVQELKYYGNLFIEGLLKIVRLLDEESENYDGDVRLALLRAGFFIRHEVTSISKNLRVISDLESIKYAISGSLRSLAVENLQLDKILVTVTVTKDNIKLKNLLHDVTCQYAGIGLATVFGFNQIVANQFIK